MNKRRYFKVNEPAVAYENFDNEIVIINFDSSNYYSFSNSGVDVWKLITDGVSVEEIIEVLTFKYDGDQKLISETISNLVEKLLKEGLIVVLEENDIVVKHQENLFDKCEKISFQAPVLEKFSDMEELLLLDPIHEVEESGWPHKKT